MNLDTRKEEGGGDSQNPNGPEGYDDVEHGRLQRRNKEASMSHMATESKRDANASCVQQSSITESTMETFSSGHDGDNGKTEGRDVGAGGGASGSIVASAPHPEAPARKTSSIVSAPPAKLPIMGGTANRREVIFVISAGIMLAFNSGYINGSCLSGLLTPHHVTRSVAGFTGTYTNSALNLADGDMVDFGVGIGMIFSFLFGSTVTGFLTPTATAYRIEPTYGPTFLLGAICLLIASVLAATEHDESWFFNFAAAANGIQNGISSSYSSNLIRTCHLTGTTTDIGLFLGQALRGNLTNLWKLMVLSSLALAFWIGSILSFFATKQFTSYSLLFNSGLFFLIGISLILFLVHELHITVNSAMLGTWQWKEALEKLNLSLRVEAFASTRNLSHNGGLGGDSNISYAQQLVELFDVIDADKNGLITEDELLTALNAAGVKIRKREVKVLIRVADSDNDGTISRDEWESIARMSSNNAKSLSASLKASVHGRMRK